ncbi:MAG TPA: type I 3-dehydroquinate dehydratase [Polyangia bacterium]|nr:type I 3-dehydroquinate dehydratase [Polyangia bacterium]
MPPSSPSLNGPLVVGVADSPVTLTACAAQAARDRPFDLVEARVDLFATQSLDPDTQAACAQLEATGTPVLVTIRSTAQGGRYAGAESARLALFRESLRVASWIDVEDDAAIAGEVARLVAARPGAKLIVSHHDFQRTPPLDELLRVVDRAQVLAPAAIAKVATAVTSDADRTVLRALLAQRPARTAVIGMGDDNFRIELAAAGSLLAYGFVGSATAPGQTSAQTLHARLLEAAPAYAARRAAAI